MKNRLSLIHILQERPLERKNHYQDPGMAEVKMSLLETMCDRMAQSCDPRAVRKMCIRDR